MTQKTKRGVVVAVLAVVLVCFLYLFFVRSDILFDLLGYKTPFQLAKIIIFFIILFIIVVAIIRFLVGPRLFRRLLIPHGFGLGIASGGVLIIHWAYEYFPVAGQPETNSLPHHILRDIGIALIVSGVLAILYEIYFRYLIDMERIESVLNLLYGSNLPTGVWGGVVDMLTKRDQLRDEFIFEIRINSAEVTSNGAHDWYKIVSKQTFNLYTIWNVTRLVKSQHEINQHVAPSPALWATGYDCRPHFTSVKATWGQDSRTVLLTGAPQETSLLDGTVNWNEETLTIEHEVQPFHEGKPFKVEVEKVEYRRCPGLYYLVLTEITKGITIKLADCPSEVSVHLTVWQDEINRPTTELVQGHDKPLGLTLLPGHCLEFKLRKKTST